ncbi:hypothetical protein [Micromonospora schwarzwaldensis]|uniref:hypothetical protein n=1 Tax=Micromonospora sp. DSM 45708 TaxID=3111767 RepID=UPI0031DF9431
MPGKELLYFVRGAPEMETTAVPPLIHLVPLADHNVGVCKQIAELGFGIAKVVERVDGPKHTRASDLGARIQDWAGIPASGGTPLHEVLG